MERVFLLPGIILQFVPFLKGAPFKHASGRHLLQSFPQQVLFDKMRRIQQG
jgi:hypothetical protein